MKLEKASKDQKHLIPNNQSRATDTTDLIIDSISLDSAIKMVKDQGIDKEVLEASLRKGMSQEALIQLCLSMKEDLILAQQKVLDMQNQVKFFKGLVKNKR